jgi:hypothetical protein
MRRFLPLLIAAFAVVPVGCGRSSNSRSSTAADLFGAQSSSTTAAGAPGPGLAGTGSSTTSGVPATPGFKTIATVTQDDDGTDVSELYQLGPISYGTDAGAPSAALTGCGSYANAEPATNAYAEGQVTFRYSTGSLPLDPMISLDHVFEDSENYEDGGAEGMIGMMAIEFDGQWTCGGEDQEADFNITLQPGEVSTDPFWLILPQVLTNAQPKLTQLQLNSLVFNPGIELNNAPPVVYPTIGPSAFNCGQLGTLVLPFAQAPPFSVLGGSCTAAG